jgi:hypothetical protein
MFMFSSEGVDSCISLCIQHVQKAISLAPLQLVVVNNLDKVDIAKFTKERFDVLRRTGKGKVGQEPLVIILQWPYCHIGRRYFRGGAHGRGTEGR